MAEPEEQDAPSEQVGPDLILRWLETALFCCLATLAIVWMSDRLRSFDFDPLAVLPCAAETCTAAADTDPLATAQPALNPVGLVVFSNANLCAYAQSSLQSVGSARSELLLARLSTEGILGLRAVNAEAVVMVPGSGNDGWFDVLRDALRSGQGGGCHPMRYGPLLWPLLAIWGLLAGLRLWRHAMGREHPAA